MLTWISRSCVNADMDIKVACEGRHGYQCLVERLAWVSRLYVNADMDIKVVW